MRKVSTHDGSYRAVVVIPIYNALSQTARCIQSVLKYRGDNTLVVLVDDASDSETRDYLRGLRSERDLKLIENESNLGFCKSANRGLATAKGEGPFVVLLNSDTVVTPGWLGMFEDCFDSDPKIGLATAVSNNAENFSLTLPEGTNYQWAARALGFSKQNEYPDIATAIGFCMGIRTEVLDSIGFLDESFGRGYGEDSDYHYRVVTAGMRSVLVPSCFIHHDSLATFGDDRAVQRAQNAPAFERRWKTIHDRSMAEAEERSPIPALQEKLDQEAAKGRVHDILFILPSWVLAGGIVVVYELVNRLIERGVDANVIIVAEPQPIEMDLLFAPYFRPHEQWREEIPHARVYVATRYDTAPYAAMARMRHIDSQLAYLIQGYEGWFAGAHLSDVVSTYRAIPHRIVVSSWLQTMLERWEISSECIPNGVDTKFFTPPSDRIERARRGKELTFLTLLRDDPQGGWRVSFEIIRRLKSLAPVVRVIGVGDLVHQPEIAGFLDEHHTTASRRKMRDLYRKSDIFLDSSIVQGFGLMGLEAMSCGVAVVLSATGGVREYANDENALFCQIGDVESAVTAVKKLIEQPVLRERLAREGRVTAEKFDWDPVIRRYEQYFKGVIAGHPAFDLYATAEMLLSLFQHSKEMHIAQNIGLDLFRREFESLSGPRSVADAFDAHGHRETLLKLQSCHEGQLLIRLYQAAVDAVTAAQSGDVPSPSSQTLLERVIRSVQ